MKYKKPTLWLLSVVDVDIHLSKFSFHIDINLFHIGISYTL